MSFTYEPEKDFDALLGLMVAMVESMAGRPIEPGMEWKNDRQTLAKKFVWHLKSIQTIRSGSMIQVGGLSAPFVDHGSVNVIARAVVENYIVFAHVFAEADEETSRHRHMVWRYCGLKDRQKRTAITQEGRMTLALERQQIEGLLKEIKAHPIFRAQSNGRQKRIEKGDWSGGRQWSELAVESGLNSRYFQNVYSYLCDYSHSSYAAALQVGQAKTEDVQADMARGILGVLNLSMARFIAIYANLFDPAGKTLESSDAREIAARWNFESERFEKIYADRTEVSPPKV